jgi:hypothetical protein
MTNPRSVLLAAAALILAGTASAPAGTLLPDFFKARFVKGQAVDNKYFPLPSGRRAVLRAKGVDEDGELFTERTALRVARRPGPTILGLRAVVQVDKAFEDGLLVEKTRDYYAQDKRGNVWYLGEDVINYHYDERGKLVSTDSESAWRAGRRGALPGWAMAAKQIIGQRYYQEFSPRDEAQDIGRTHAILPSLKVGGVTYRNVLRVLETNPFEPGDREFKYYAPRVGLIRIEEGLNRHLRNPELVFNLRPHAKATRTAARSRPGDDGKADRQRVSERRAAKVAKAGGGSGGRVAAQTHGKGKAASQRAGRSDRAGKVGSRASRAASARSGKVRGKG